MSPHQPDRPTRATIRSEIAHSGSDHDPAALPDHDHSAGVAESTQHEGMDLAESGHDSVQAAHAGSRIEGAHREHARTDHTGHERLFRRRFWVCLMLSVLVLLYSPMIQEWLGFSAPAFPGSDWIAPIFAVAVFAYGGTPFLRMAVPELRNRQPGMMTLISLAIGVAFAYSVAVMAWDRMGGFFWELVTLIDIMLLGHWLEMRSVRQASGALDELAKLVPDTAERLREDGSVETIPVGALRPGDRVVIRPGASIPADGEVEEGESDVNESMITGESRPVSKRPGNHVIAGALNGDGSLRMHVSAAGSETALAGIMRLVEEAQRSKSRTQLLADRAAGWLFYVALAVAVLTAVAWTLAIGFRVEVVERVATVLVIACPHALGLAIPLVVAITTALGARNGILVRDRLALETAREIDTIIFDKTGTLTEGEFGVVAVALEDAWDEDRALALAAAVEGDSEHTIARAVRRSAQNRGLSAPTGSEFKALKGRGVRASVDGREALVGGPRLIESLGVDLPARLARFADEAGERGQTVVYLISESAPVAAFALADVVRPESREAVRRLQEMGIRVAMLTGDSRPVAEAVAAQLGIDEFFAEVLPEQKDRQVAELQRQGRRVAMVGDGINDAPALSRADVGIAIGSGTDVAVESAGIILVRNNPLDVVRIIRLSRASYRKMVQNLVWATGYNVIALPLAAGVLAWAGILLSPAMGAVFMSASTVIVALNAQLLRRAI